jgi:hypothetical protein
VLLLDTITAPDHIQVGGDVQQQQQQHAAVAQR